MADLTSRELFQACFAIKPVPLFIQEEAFKTEDAFIIRDLLLLDGLDERIEKQIRDSENYKIFSIWVQAKEYTTEEYNEVILRKSDPECLSHFVDYKNLSLEAYQKLASVGDLEALILLYANKSVPLSVKETIIDRVASEEELYVRVSYNTLQALTSYDIFEAVFSKDDVVSGFLKSVDHARSKKEHSPFITKHLNALLIKIKNFDSNTDSAQVAEAYEALSAMTFTLANRTTNLSALSETDDADDVSFLVFTRNFIKENKAFFKNLDKKNLQAKDASDAFKALIHCVKDEEKVKKLFKNFKSEDDVSKFFEKLQHPRRNSLSIIFKEAAVNKYCTAEMFEKFCDEYYYQADVISSKLINSVNDDLKLNALLKMSLHNEEMETFDAQLKALANPEVKFLNFIKYLLKRYNDFDTEDAYETSSVPRMLFWHLSASEFFTKEHALLLPIETLERNYRTKQGLATDIIAETFVDVLTPDVLETAVSLIGTFEGTLGDFLEVIKNV